MKKYGKLASAGLFVILGAFILLQYQNCGNSSNTSNSSPIEASGLSYTLTLSAPSSASHSSPVAIPINIVSSGSEQTYAVVGWVSSNGTKQELCKIASPGPSANWSNNNCTTGGIPLGSYPLYLDILDYNYPSYPIMLDCSPSTGPLQAGCAGNYQIAITQ